MGVAKGSFDVKLKPLPAYAAEVDPNLGRMSIDKEFHGDLEGSSIGEMLAAATRIKDSAGYVAIERVSGTLGGRRGTFLLQHSATMTRGVPALSIAVVPDSGTDGLEGLSGRMTIRIEGKNHFYELEYTRPDSG
jgi:hypothetical protein